LAHAAKNASATGHKRKFNAKASHLMKTKSAIAVLAAVFFGGTFALADSSVPKS